MKRLTLLLALLFATVAHGQTTYPLIEKPSSAKVADAKATMDAIKDAPVNMGIGGYALIQIKVTTKLTTYTVPGSSDCLDTETIPKGKVIKQWFVPDGGKEWVRVTIPADNDYDRLLVTGTIKGTATILWMTVANGEAVVVAGYRFDVAGGKPAPPVIIPPDEPVIPVEDELTKKLRAAARLDEVAGKAEKKHLLPLAGIYLGASNDPLETLNPDGKTKRNMNMGEVDTVLHEARKRAGIPDHNTVFPYLRKAVQQEIHSRLGVGPDSHEVPLTDDTKRLARLAFGKIAVALEVLSK